MKIKLKKHWQGFALLLFGAIYIIAVNAFINAQEYGMSLDDKKAFESNISIALLNNSSLIVFFACIILFITHALLLRHKGWKYVWLKIGFIPIYVATVIVLFFLLFFQAD